MYDQFRWDKITVALKFQRVLYRRLCHFTNPTDKFLGQSNADGLFDDNSDVDIETDGNIISFTLTGSLATEINGYVCSFHPEMNGEISVTE